MGVSGYTATTNLHIDTRCNIHTTTSYASADISNSSTTTDYDLCTTAIINDSSSYQLLAALCDQVSSTHRDGEITVVNCEPFERS